MHKTLIDLSSSEAKKYLLNQESYFNNDLPEYFDFSTLLIELSNIIDINQNNNIFNKTAKQKLKSVNDVNYQLILNKDGRLGWRSVELIHPVLYVSLVHLICEEQNWLNIQERFHNFKKESYIECCSLPSIPNQNEKSKARQINYWWTDFEQQSIFLSLDFDYMLQTDVSNCYSSIYTHSIAWALHGKEICKENLTSRDNKLLGDQIDKYIQLSRYGQTNGIPQGSILMDLIAELVLGYVDTLVTEKLQRIFNNKEENKIKILRYRDDYRIFTKNAVYAEQILQTISNELRSIGMALNISKTNISHDIIQSSIKKDKLILIQSPNFEALNAKTLQKKLLYCYMFSIQHPNSGSLMRLLTELNRDYLVKKKVVREIYQHYKSLIAITTNIAITSPKAFPQIAVILNHLFYRIKQSINENDIQNIWDKTIKKINHIPNNGYFEIWLQRIAIPNKLNYSSNEKICKMINDNSLSNLWNNDWIEDKKLLKIIKCSNTINQKKIEELPKIIKPREIELFKRKYI